MRLVSSHLPVCGSTCLRLPACLRLPFCLRLTACLQEFDLHAATCLSAGVRLAFGYLVVCWSATCLLVSLLQFTCMLFSKYKDFCNWCDISTFCFRQWKKSVANLSSVGWIKVQQLFDYKLETLHISYCYGNFTHLTVHNDDDNAKWNKAQRHIQHTVLIQVQRHTWASLRGGHAPTLAGGTCPHTCEGDMPPHLRGGHAPTLFERWGTEYHWMNFITSILDNNRNMNNIFWDLYEL